MCRQVFYILIRKISLLLALSLLLSVRGQAISAKSYALVEQETGRLLEGQNTAAQLPMASTTKVMTGLLACESGHLDETYTIPAEALRVEGSSMGLVAGERLTLREITYGLMLESGNDAANAVALLLAGSIPAFAEMMNGKASELGLRQTHFMNPSGLDHPAHYTSALDLARLGAAAMKNADFKAIVSTYKIRVPYDGLPNGRLLVNHNELLRMFDGVVGIKTGYTKRSGRCLVSCAERGGVTLVAATLNGQDDWNDHIALLGGGFQVLGRYRLMAVHPELVAQLAGGVSDTVRLTCRDDLEASLRREEISRVKMEVVLRRFTYAPVEAGQRLGALVFRLDGDVLAETPLYAAETVAAEKPNKWKNFWLSIFH